MALIALIYFCPGPALHDRLQPSGFNLRHLTRKVTALSTRLGLGLIVVLKKRAVSALKSQYKYPTISLGMAT